MRPPARKESDAACHGDRRQLWAFSIVISDLEEDVEGVFLGAVDNRHRAERTETHRLCVFKMILPSWKTRMKIQRNGVGIRATRSQGKKRCARWTW